MRHDGPMTHVFDEALALEFSDGVAYASTHPAYANMVGPFGGITAATVLRAILAHPDRVGEPIALTVNFTAPLGAGGWQLDARAVRTNRTNQHWTVLGEQDGKVVLTATAVLSNVTEGWGSQEVTAPDVPKLEMLDYVPNPFPLAWLDNYEMRFAEGGINAIPSEGSRSVLRLRHADPRAWDAEAIACAADAFFPRVFLRLGPRTAAGTVSMTTYFHATAAELAAAGETLLLDATASRYSRGTYDQSGHVFGDDGTLLATTHQAVYFKPDAL